MGAGKKLVAEDRRVPVLPVIRTIHHMAVDAFVPVRPVDLLDGLLHFLLVTRLAKLRWAIGLELKAMELVAVGAVDVGVAVLALQPFLVDWERGEAVTGTADLRSGDGLHNHSGAVANLADNPLELDITGLSVEARRVTHQARLGGILCDPVLLESRVHVSVGVGSLVPVLVLGFVTVLAEIWALIREGGVDG